MESYGVYPSQKLHKLTPVLLTGTGRSLTQAGIPCRNFGWASSCRILRVCLCVRPGASLGLSVPPLCSTSYRFLNSSAPEQFSQVHSGQGRLPGATCASSCAGPGGLTWRRLCRRGGTGRAGGPCACGSGGWARRSGRTSSRSLPSCSGRAFHLVGETGERDSAWHHTPGNLPGLIVAYPLIRYRDLPWQGPSAFKLNY